ERLLLWALLQRGKAISDLNVEDVAEFQRFLMDPQPYDRWVSPRAFRRDQAGWRPFVQGKDKNGAPLYGLSRASTQTALTILSSRFSWLVEMRYLASNPSTALPRFRANREVQTGRSLTQAQWDYLTEYAHTLPVDDPHVTRVRF